MAQEIERKFLVKDESYISEAFEATHIAQGYLCLEPGRTVRVRIRGEKGYITVKGPLSQSGMSRYEWEEEIPLEEAGQMIALCSKGLIDKTRYLVNYEGHTFEVDKFHGDNEGLTIAEIELKSEDEDFSRPHWLGEEVTGDRRYYNSQLVNNPSSRWH